MSAYYVYNDLAMILILQHSFITEPSDSWLRMKVGSNRRPQVMLDIFSKQNKGKDQEELKFESSMLIYCGNVFW